MRSSYNGPHLNATRKLLAVRGQELETTREILSGRAADLNATRESLAVQGQQLETTREILSQRAADLSATRELLALRGQQLEATQEILSQRDADLTTLETALAAVYRSTSWRLMAPLRWVGRHLQRTLAALNNKR